MKKVVVVLFAILLTVAAVPVWAASNPQVAEIGEESYDSLRLTDEQKQQIKPVLEERQQQIKQVLQDPSLTPEEKWAKTDDIRGQSRAAIDQYLTPEQKIKADSVRSENDAQRGKVREEQKKVISDKQQLKEDRSKLQEDRKDGNKEAAQEDKDKLREDRQQRANDRRDRHQVRQQGKEDRRDRRQAGRT